MKNRVSDILTCILFCGFIFGMLALYLFLPEQTFSEKEKRYLAQSPKLETDSLLSGEWGEEIETFLADHVPGRDLFVGINAYYDLLSGRQVTKNVYLAEGDRLVEAPYELDQDAIDRNMSTINLFAETAGVPIDLMIVPSAGYVLQDKIIGTHNPYKDAEIIKTIYNQAGTNVNPVDLLPIFTQAENPENLYYRTDHHWTSLGAYTAYSAYMELLDRDYPTRDQFTVERHQGFLGSTYSRSGLWQIPGEIVELWNTNTAFTVSNTDNPEPHQGLFYKERLQELDQYTVYLDGNHGFVTIENPNAVGKGHLLVVRDSYANCLGTFLANSYETVTLIDLRYYKNPISELLAEKEYTDILVCYSLGNFLTDENIIWLE